MKHPKYWRSALNKNKKSIPIIIFETKIEDGKRIYLERVEGTQKAIGFRKADWERHKARQERLLKDKKNGN